MLRLIAYCAQLLEFIVAAPVRAFRFFFSTLILNPRLGRLRIVTGLVAGYVIFGLILVYPFAFFWGLAGQAWFGKVLAYANERSLGTAIYDRGGRFVGIFDPVLDSKADFNYSGRPIELPGYIAYPDHKSLHVSAVPEHYWACLKFHEDRHLGGILNPWGIDLAGYLKIPLSTLTRSIDAGSLKLGAGGSTISMQLARIFFKETPSRDEGALTKLERKFKEWWLAPVIHRGLTRGRDLAPLKRWAANHFPLAQRTGAGPLYGVEQTALVIFGKRAADLSVGEQYVLAAAVNQPVILLEGGAKLNAYRLASWRRVTGQRARICANNLIADDREREAVTNALEQMAASPPDPKTPPGIARALAELAPKVARPAGANPVRRSNTLIPAARYGVREEIRNRYGFAWRSHLSGVEITLNVAENLAFRDKILDRLSLLQSRHKARINPRYTIDLRAAQAGDGGTRVPDIVIAAADETGAIVRYFETNHTAAYFGSARAHDRETGKYDAANESRFIASIAKMAAAIAIANEGTDTRASPYLDTAAPPTGLETCAKGTERRLRRADLAFACSLNAPIAWRMRQITPRKLQRIVNRFALTTPVGGPGMAKSLTVGQIAASPQTVHRMAGTILQALSAGTPGEFVLRPPTLVRTFHQNGASASDAATEIPAGNAKDAIPSPIRAEGRTLLRDLLSAPLCYRHGTLRRLADWCATSRSDIRLHFAKTGTRGTGASDAEADDTVDLWVAGGIRFAAGPAFSYVVLVGTGNPNAPWGRDLYAGSVAEPLVRALLDNLAVLAKNTRAKAAAKSASATENAVLDR